MNQIITIALQIISYLVQNKDTIKQLILDIEALIPDSPGAVKAQVVRNFIGTALGIEAQLEAAWTAIGPMFNAFVAMVKVPKPASAPQ